MTRVRTALTNRARADAPDWSITALKRAEFIDKVREFGVELYRDLPWRHVDNAYSVLVSEVMLQQTQVSRVLGYWDRWMRLFPNVDALAVADTSLVLETWQGLGYNRRALALKRCCETCAEQYGGDLPQSVEKLIALPGIGPATAAGVIAFAFDLPSMYLETNVRSVFLHELFPDREGVSDREIAPYVADACPQEGGAWGPRNWYYALLDYGAHLKKQIANPSRRSAHHTRQSKFEGSRREKRSFVLRQVLAAPEGIAQAEVQAALGDYEREAGRERPNADLFASIVQELVAEGFFRQEDELLIP